MSKSVRIDDDIHEAMKERSNKSGIDISRLIEFAWKDYEENSKLIRYIDNQLEVKENEDD